MSLSKAYYTIEEAVNKIKEIESHITAELIYHYAEIEKIRLDVYVNSRPVLALKYNPTIQEESPENRTLFNEFLEISNPQNKYDYLFIGACHLHGLYRLTLEELCPIISRGRTLIEIMYADLFVYKPTLSYWSTTLPEDIAKVRPESIIKTWQPEVRTNDTVIHAYYLRPEYIFKILNKGQFLYENYKNIPPKMVDDIKKFSFGETQAFLENQSFDKTNLRITNEELKKLIELIKSKGKVNYLITDKPKEFTHNATIVGEMILDKEEQVGENDLTGLGEEEKLENKLNHKKIHLSSPQDESKGYLSLVNNFKELGNIQKGNTVLNCYLAIQYTLEFLKQRDRDFDPFNMPGTRQDFYDFFKKIPGSEKLIKGNGSTKLPLETFAKYTKGTVISSKEKHYPKLCSWKRRHVPTDYFEKIKISQPKYNIVSVMN